MNDVERELAQLRAIVEENIEISRRNQRMLLKIRNSMRTHTIMRVVYVTLIVGSMLGIYYYLQPLFDTVGSQYNELISLPDKIIPDALRSEN